MIGADRAGGKNNLEQIGGEFVTFTLNPWLKALQQELDRKLFPKTGQNARKFFPHFETRPLIMPDASSRKDFYSAGKQWGFLCTDDILEMEHLNPTDQEGSDLGGERLQLWDTELTDIGRGLDRLKHRST